MEVFRMTAIRNRFINFLIEFLLTNFFLIISWKLGQCWATLGTNAEETGFKVCLQILHFYYIGRRLYKYNEDDFRFKF